MTTDSIRYAEMSSPVGRLLLTATPRGLSSVWFLKGRPAKIGADWVHDEAALAEPLWQLRAYFDGSLCEFALDLDPRGTPFQQRVWTRLLEIPWGETTSYGDIARRIGQPAAVRAVGAANGRNPIPIIVPCHRVVGADGSLTGYGGGLDAKRWLLDHEGVRLDNRGVERQMRLEIE